MIKRVNVKVTSPIRTTKVHIFNSLQSVMMSTDDIIKCICAGAYVDEILPSGKIVRLNTSNYNRVFEETPVEVLEDLEGETDPAETDPAETDPADTDPADTDDKSDEDKDDEEDKLDPDAPALNPDDVMSDILGDLVQE